MVELLAPAGDMACFQAAISAGADAVYVGGDKFGARAYAKNFCTEELVELLRTAHLFGKKVYLTINTLMKEKELSELIPFLVPYYEEGLDGVIVQDFGALSLIKEAFPKLPLHASTQMTVTGEKGAGLLKESGVSRVVPARELSLEEIVRIKEKTGLEIETFIHGAMCYSYSGQCLFSSMLGPRSGNRGRCAGPCRLPYQTCLDGKVLNGKNQMYQLSLKDLCVLEILPELIEAGIDSFKIEGRMKSPQYVSFVTGMYRKYIDFYMENPKAYSVSGEDMLRLQNNFSRGSVQSGYYFMHNGPELVTLNKPGYQSFDKGNTECSDAEADSGSDEPAGLTLPGIDLTGHFVAREGKPLELTVGISRQSHGKHLQSEPSPEEPTGGVSLTVTGSVPMQAQNRAATEADVEKQLRKTGNTPFRFVHISYEMDDNLFLPNKELNELRRNALNKTEEMLLQPFRRRQEDSVRLLSSKTCKSQTVSKAAYTPQAVSLKADGYRRLRQRYFHVGVETGSQLLALPEDTIIKAIYLSFDALEDMQSEETKKIKALKASGIEIFLRLPSVVRRRTVKLFENYRNRIMEINPDGFAVGNLESLAYVREHYKEKICVTDSGCYLFNPRTCVFYEKLGLYTHILSCELHKKEIESLLAAPESRNHAFILPVYGYIPVMESAGCVLKTNRQCRKGKTASSGNEVFLTDRQNKKFRVLPHCNRCENTIYNSVPLSLHKETADIVRLPLDGVALRFTTENSGEVTDILNNFKKMYEADNLSGNTGFTIREFTKGHFLKGVE